MPATNPSTGPDMDLPLSCDEKEQHVQWSDLPLCCPAHGTTVWNAHPRVYLPIHRDGRARCGYCGTLYVLDPPTPGEPVPTFSNMEIEKDYSRARRKAEQAAEGSPASSA